MMREPHRTFPLLVGRWMPGAVGVGAFVGALAAAAPPLSAQVPAQSVVPVYDGWFANEDGGYTLCFGYMNPNTEESLDVPLGPQNHLIPAEYDGVQPTHFDPVPDPELTSPYPQNRCVFTVDVPDDFDGDVVWTLTTQGNELTVPGSLLPDDVLAEPASPDRGAVAPSLRLGLTGTLAQGRGGVWEGPVRARVGQPVSLMAWVSHEASGTWLGWAKHQGPGEVVFDAEEFRLDSAEGVAEVIASFDAPGRYVLRVQAINDPETSSNPTFGFESQCCWTNGYVIVEVSE